MSKLFLYHDAKRCIGCLSCEAHCKAGKALPIGPRLTRLIPVGPKMINNLPRTAYVYMPCFQCEEPWCVSACPTGAMQKRAQDGIVFVDEASCIGCKSCITACPWGTPQWNAETGKVAKCDYCMDRIDQGLEPACVRKCLTKCLHFGKVEDEAMQIRRKRWAESVAVYG